MTIALGILGSNYAVIGADSQVSYGDAAKIYQTKVFPLVDGSSGSDGILISTGAGDTNYIEAFVKDELMYEFLDSDILDQFERGFKNKLLDFMQKHGSPPDGMSLILAAQRKGDIRMWKTHNSVVHRCRDSYAAVGVGESYARNLLSRLPTVESCAVSAQLMATYTINRVKDFVPYCGKHTEVVSLRSGSNTVCGFSGAQTRGLEDVFDRYGSIEAAAMSRMLCMSTSVAVESRIDSLAESIKRIIEDGY